MTYGIILISEIDQKLVNLYMYTESLIIDIYYNVGDEFDKIPVLSHLKYMQYYYARYPNAAV